MNRLPSSIVILAAALLLGAPVSADPTADRHELKWFVHTDLVSGGNDLAFYEAMIDASLEDALLILEGSQGPVDSVCCQKLDKEEHAPSVDLATFGTTGDGLDVVDGGDYSTLQGLGGSGTRAFLVDSILNCNGGSAIGCADLPSCNTNYDDDPDQILVVTLDADDSGVLGAVVAHERGHNACLQHVANNECELMQAIVGGGCLSAGECTNFGTARQTTGGSCACHAGTTQGTADPDATSCTDGPITGLCSGGVCGETPGVAGVELIACAGPGAASGETADDPLRLSSLTGGWEDLADLGVTLKALDYDPDGDVLYGIQDAVGADLFVTLDRSSWTVLTSTALTGHDDVISMAFDPGATSGSGDDRLLALSSDGSFEDLIEIDPATANTTLLGPLNIGAPGNFTGLAYDFTRQRLYTSSVANTGLYEIDLTACGNPFFCTTTQVPGLSVAREDSSLGYSSVSDALHLVGRVTFNLSGGGTKEVTFHDTIDAATLTESFSIGVDPYTPSGLAAIPVPEPGFGWGLSAGGLLLGALTARRRSAVGR